MKVQRQVVLCKDCTHYKEIGFDTVFNKMYGQCYCHYHNIGFDEPTEVFENEYCSNGEEIDQPIETNLCYIVGKQLAEGFCEVSKFTSEKEALAFCNEMQTLYPQWNWDIYED